MSEFWNEVVGSASFALLALAILLKVMSMPPRQPAGEPVLGDMRAEFKAWVESQGCDTDGAWSAWQGCWNLLHAAGTPASEVAGFRDPATWAAYIAGVIDTYLSSENAVRERDRREEAIAGIIRRRIHWLMPSAPCVEVRDATERRVDAVPLVRVAAGDVAEPVFAERLACARVAEAFMRDHPELRGTQGWYAANVISATILARSAEAANCAPKLEGNDRWHLRTPGVEGRKP